MHAEEPSESLLKDIETLGSSAAWHAANSRVKYDGDAKKDKKAFYDAADKIRASNLFTSSLADDIIWCAWNMAWLRAN